MGTWHGSLAYRAWVIGGLVVVVGVSVGLGLANPTDQRVIFAIPSPLAIYVGGMLWMQGRAARGVAAGSEGSPMSTRAEEPALGDDPPKGWGGLTRVLAVKPIERGGRARREQGERRDMARPGALRSRSDADVQGPTVMSGRRHGRSVRIEMLASDYETRVSKRAPSFSVTSDDGKLKPAREAPAAVAGALDPLSADARWRGVEVEGGSEGIVVRRRVKGRARMESLWMDDLWLAERLADAVAD